MAQENVGTFHAEPFAGIAGSKPERSRRRRSERHDPKPKQFHGKPHDTALEPESLAQAIEMREAIKGQLFTMQAEVRGLNGWRRSKAVAAITAAQSRCSDLSRWIKSRTIPDVRWPKSSDIVSGLLAILDRLEEDGVSLSDDEVEAMNVAAEFVAFKRESDAVRAAVNSGKVPADIDG